jgi:isoleucyl-tRNA synthetase
VSLTPPDSGTGFVHLAPGFGEDDHRVCVAAGVVGKEDARTCPVDKEGRFEDVIGDGLARRHVKECDKDIIRLVKDKGCVARRTHLRRAGALPQSDLSHPRRVPDL